MAAPARLSKFVFGGPLAITETWSCSLMFANASVTTPDPAAVTTALENLVGLLPALGHVNFWKWNDITPSTGKYADAGSSNTWLIDPELVGAGGNLPPQCALVMTHRTLLSRGPAHVGRVYIPTANPGIGLDGRMDASTAAFSLGFYHQFLVDLQTALGAFPIVWSQKYQVWEVITGLECGRVVDTQRRRRKTIDEDPAVLALSQ